MLYIKSLIYKLQKELEYESFGFNTYLNSFIHVVESDMRELKDNPIMQAYKADVIVSELLGSFGDNELSPECLDGIHPSLRKKDCVSIPQEYTSYIAPCTSFKLHNEAKMQSFTPYEGGVTGMLRAMETPYVVRTYACSQTHGEEACFRFCHFEEDQGCKERFVSLEFRNGGSFGFGSGCGYGPFHQSDVSEEGGGCTIHGFLGTFDATLYKSVHISIAPSTFSHGMFSWFPLYFPIKEPLFIPKNSVLRVCFWRRCEKKGVWYEWCCEVVGEDGEVIGVCPVCNSDGRSYVVRL